VILGHSERRTDHGETDALVKSKADAALLGGLVAIVCIGETEAERDAGQTLAVIGRQLDGSLPDNALAANTVIAYEPVWAIGTGVTATTDQAQEAHAFVRSLIAELYGSEPANKIRIQYGGSVKPNNAAELMACPDIDGALIGGASLDPQSFLEIISNGTSLE
jgi:triosephosphate isomerase (TIM)